MSFDWYSFYRLAVELAANQRITDITEAYFRTAVNRSYYSVFCRARNVLKKNVRSVRKKTITILHIGMLENNLRNHQARIILK